MLAAEVINVLRRQRNDPAGVSDHPNVVTDPVREAGLVAEVRRKIEYLIESYRREVQLGLDRKSFNTWLARMKKAVDQPSNPNAQMERIDPWLELKVNTRARELAGLAPDAMLEADHGSFVRLAVVALVTNTRPVRGRPGRVTLRRYVEALMALLQEATGKLVMAPREKDYDYAPHLRGFAQSIRVIVNALQPGVPDTELSYWVRDTRKKYTGKPMRFLDYFPAYGVEVGDQVSLSQRQLEVLSINAVLADGQTIRSCYGYDGQGNRISETKPRAALTVCP